jgi:putative colanic acid biosynthesis acetyltransferase WcaF
MSKTNDTMQLGRFRNLWYQPGAMALRVIWHVVDAILMRSWIPSSGMRIFLLRSFGAKVGRGVVIKPWVSVKYPWFLEIADDVWIGERVWIDCLAQVTVGSNVCVSQGAMILCGNHDYSSVTFDLKLGEVVIEDGVWIGAKSVVCPGVTCKKNAVLTVGSVATKTLEEDGIYQGNPAMKVRGRKILDSSIEL